MGHFDLQSAVVLARVVRSGSFRAAARALGISKSSVSRKVAELEEQLGAQLVHRTTRTVALTDAGTAFVGEIEGALAHIEAAEQAVSELQDEPRGRLRVTTTLPLGQLVLAPLVAEFLAAHPRVEVALHLTDRRVDLVAERVDVALRIGPLEDSSLVAQPLGEARLRVFASPAYLEARGTPRAPADLAGHECLRIARSGAAPRSTWNLGRGRRQTEVPVSGRLVADDFLALREAAVHGLGLAQLPSLLARDAEASGALVAVLDAYVPPPTPVYLVYVAGRHLPPRTRAFLDFVRPRIAALTSADRPAEAPRPARSGEPTGRQKRGPRRSSHGKSRAP